MTFSKFFLTSFVLTITLISCKGRDKENKTPAVDTDLKEVSQITADADTTNLLMEENEFWKLIDKSSAAANNNYQQQISSLKTLLLVLDPSDIEKFGNRFTALLAASYDYGLWGAAYVINGGCSDDCFHYFRVYLIGHGKEKFYQTIKNPETCASWIKSEEEDNWEGLQYAIMDAYKQKTGKEIPKTFQPKFELKGKPFDEETVQEQYPILAKKFMGDY
jgi:hypothetical protein